MMMMIMVLMTIMEMIVIVNWIKITKITRADSSKVDFSNGVCSSSHFKLPNLCPGVCRRTEEKHLQAKARHHIISQRIPLQYLISVVIPIILSSNHHKLLFEETSSGTVHCPGKNLLCPEQHF